MSREKIILVEKILNRVKNYFDLKNDKELAQFLGIKQTALSMWKKRNYIDMNLLFPKITEVDLEWLIYGESENRISNTVNELQQTYTAKNKEVEILKDELKKIDVDDKQNSTEVANLKERIAHQESEITFLREQLKTTNEMMKGLIKPSSA